MKMQNTYKINHIDQTITLTKKFAKEAGILNTPEYRTLNQLRTDYPDYTISLREIAKRENKKSYANLTYDAMRQFITIVEGEQAENLRQLELVIELSKGQTGRYAYVKAWFLKHYPDYNNVEAIA